MNEQLTFEECLEWSENYTPMDTSNKQFWTIMGGLAASSAVIAGAGYVLSSGSSPTPPPQIANGGPPPNPPAANLPSRQENRTNQEQDQIIEQNFTINSPNQQQFSSPNQQQFSQPSQVNNLLSPGSIITGDDGLQYEIID